MAVTILNVPDISCAHCEQAVTQALTPVDGVQAVRVDIPAKQVRVEYDERTVGVERMREVLAEEDYPVASAQASGQ